MPINRSPQQQYNLRSNDRNMADTNRNGTEGGSENYDDNENDQMSKGDEGAVGGLGVRTSDAIQPLQGLENSQMASALLGIITTLADFKKELPSMVRNTVSDLLSGGDKFDTMLPDIQSEIEYVKEKKDREKRATNNDHRATNQRQVESKTKDTRRSRSSDPPLYRDSGNPRKFDRQDNQYANWEPTTKSSTGAIRKRLSNWREPQREVDVEIQPKPLRHDDIHRQERNTAQVNVNEGRRESDQQNNHNHNHNHNNNFRNQNNQQVRVRQNNEPHEINKIIRGWGLKFSGERSGMPVRDFLFRIETHKHRDLVSWQQVLDNFHIMIEGKADDLYWRTLRHQPLETRLTWETLRSAFIREFQPNISEIGLMRDVMNLRQGREEPFETLLKRFSDLHDQLQTKLDDRQIVELLRGSLREEIAQLIFAADIQDVRSLQGIVNRAEKQLQQQKRSQWSTPPRRLAELNTVTDSPQTVDNRNQIQRRERIADWVCWNCNERGHGFMTCERERRIFCFRCGTVDVTYLRCPNCRKGNRRASGSRSGQPRLQTTSPATQDQPQQPAQDQ